MKATFSLLFFLLFTVQAATNLQPDSISYHLISDTTTPNFYAVDSAIIPEDINKGIYRVIMQFHTSVNDSLTHLLIHFNDHPYVLTESGDQFFQRGFIDGTGTVTTFSPSLVHLPNTENDTLHFNVELYPNGDQTSFINIEITDYSNGSRSLFWINFLNSTFITSVVFSSLVICFITFLFWITSGRNNNKLFYFCLSTLALGLGHINVMFCYPGADQVLLWKIARIAYIFAPSFLLFFAVAMLKKPKIITVVPKVFITLATLFSIVIIPQTTKLGIENIFFFAVNIAGMPALFCMFLVSLYAMIKENNRAAAIPTVGVIAIFIAAIHDFSYLILDKVPLVWTIAYAYLTLEIAILILLSQEVVMLYKQNRKKSEELQNKNQELIEQRIISERVRKSKDRFLKHMSHEFRTPLQGIVSTTELLNTEGSQSDEIETIIKALNIQMQLHRLNIENVIDVSVLEDKQLDNAVKNFKIKDLFSIITDLFNNNEHTILQDLVISCDKSVPKYLCGNEEQILRILFSLLANLCLPEKSCEINLITTWDRVGTLSFTLQSCSECLEPLLLSFIEDPEKATIETTDNLSLIASIRLIESINGSLEMEEESNDIIISVPCTEVVNFLETLPVISKPRKILLAEDNPVNRMVLSKLLEKMEYNVVSVENGQEAVNIVDQEDFSMILMDVQMPIMDGIEATRKIRNSTRNQDIVIIALTANASKEECMDAGMDNFLCKPVGGNELHRIIEQYICS